jgi:methylenetetrahydrofolate dehydrogenase (NADP+)/methenyltetrahydrofolate cyclohydrolase
MPGLTLHGKPLAQRITDRIAARVADLGRPCKLLAVQVADDAASSLYTDMQAKAASAAGIEYELTTLPADISQEQLHEQLATLAERHHADGMILQMPLPAHLDARVAQQAIPPSHDVEGITQKNLGRLFHDEEGMIPPTAAAAIALLREACTRCDVSLAGKEVVVIGHSEIVGKPIASLLLQSPTESPTVTICHVATQDLSAHTKRADVLIVAAGVSQRRWKNERSTDLSPLISADMIKPGAIIIDVATNRIPVGFDEHGDPLRNESGKIRLRTVGDVDTTSALPICQAITPVPGGVGQVTVAMLLNNTLRCADKK